MHKDLGWGKEKEKKNYKRCRKGGFLALWGKTPLGVLISECIYIYDRVYRVHTERRDKEIFELKAPFFFGLCLFMTLEKINTQFKFRESAG